MSDSLKHTLRMWRRGIRGRLTRRLLGARGRAVVVHTAQGVFAVAPEDQGVGGELLRAGRYGEEELKRLAGELTADSSLLVVGAHIGALVVPLSSLCRNITAIEPNPDSYELLKLNLAINSISNCETHNIAAGERAGELEFLLSRANSGGSKIVPRTRRWDYYYDKPEKIR
ncbi:MAG TPA: FkbM family methyltransferase, partial [candidate division Zixibacteria bacterium]|nr:FkbM family methyltransferase [candidate division Zixibacteria bacterium]